MLYLLAAICIINTVFLVLILLKKNQVNPQQEEKLNAISQQLMRLESSVKEDFKMNREETSKIAKENREDIAKNIFQFSESNAEKLEKLIQKMELQLTGIKEQFKQDAHLNRENTIQRFREFQDTLDKNIKAINELQKEKFSQIDERQVKLIEATEKKLEQMRETVDEKLQKTLSERIGQSFETVGKQLEAVQLGLGEMKTLAQDVGGLKKVLGNVKNRGGLGEIQLEMLLETILAPDQYEANVKTKKGASESVEFAIKLPGRDDDKNVVWLPIDAKFPKDAYEQMQEAYESGDVALIETGNKNLENTIKKMAKDIRDKYIDPPNTTDFAIMFLPFEGIYAEVIRRSHLLEQLQREFKVAVTGPTTLAAILNSLQMGFRTLALQQRSSEVWTILGAVKTEFEKFGGMLEKAQKNITTAGSTLDELIGKRTNAINRKLRDVQALPSAESRKILPEIGIETETTEEEQNN